MKLAIIGSRTFDNYDLVKSSLEEYVKKHGKIDRIISGGAKGADSFAEKYAEEFNIPLTVFPAKWKKYGRRAGYLRNILIINECEQVIAFWDGESRGTKSSLDLAEEQGKPVTIVKF